MKHCKCSIVIFFLGVTGYLENQVKLFEAGEEVNQTCYKHLIEVKQSENGIES